MLYIKEAQKVTNKVEAIRILLCNVALSQKAEPS